MKHQEKNRRACGSWASSISAQMCAQRPEVSHGGPIFELQPGDGVLYHLSLRPAEGGRATVMRLPLQGESEELLAPPWNARSGVNEYGGAAYVADGEQIWFSHYSDARVYRLDPGEEPIALTAAGPYRYADFVMDRARNRLICVREDFSSVPEHRQEEATELVAIDLDSGDQRVLFSGPDFVAAPRLSPDGTELAWISWWHPNMPWDDACLHRAEFDEDGGLVHQRAEASPAAQARMQPRWNPPGELWYLSDADEWWNLYRWPVDQAAGERVTSLKADIGGPGWWLGARHWDFVTENQAVVVFTQDGLWRAASVDLLTGALADETEAMAMLTSVTVANDRVFVTGADQNGNGGLYAFREGELSLAHRPGARETVPEEVSKPEALIVPLPQTAHTAPGEVCYAWYYPPTNARFEPLPGELPPVIVQFHGGPTAASHSTYSMSKQFWTSRGIAVLDVNYRGSSGRGRAYRQRLYGHYGVTDVEDAVVTLNHAAELGLVDASRAVIMGASSGGYTTLAALAFHDAFAAGVNIFGVSDLSVFLEHSHKFESRFLHTLLGDSDDLAELARQRSPISGLDKIRAPLLTLQGSVDRIVPPEQSHIIMRALRDKGVPCAYLEFEGEGHGFLREESTIRMLDAIQSFLGQIFGYQPADDIPVVAVENLSHG